MKKLTIGEVVLLVKHGVISRELVESWRTKLGYPSSTFQSPEDRRLTMSVFTCVILCEIIFLNFLPWIFLGLVFGIVGFVLSALLYVRERKFVRDVEKLRHLLYCQGVLGDTEREAVVTNCPTALLANLESVERGVRGILIEGAKEVLRTERGSPAEETCRKSLREHFDFFARFQLVDPVNPEKDYKSVFAEAEKDLAKEQCTA